MKKYIALWLYTVSAVSILFHESVGAAPAIERWQHASGAWVSLVSSPGIPMLDVQLDFDLGARRDPAQQAGLAAMSTLMQLRGVRAEGAAPALDENQLGEAWADLAASWTASAGQDRVSYSLRTLTQAAVLDGAIALATRQLVQPSFPADLWSRERQRIEGELREAETRPATHAGRAFARAVYGPHPYGFETTQASLRNLSPSDFKAWHQQLHPCHAKVSLVGAIDRSQAEALVSRMLNPLAARHVCPALGGVADVAPLTQAVEAPIPFDAAQSHLLVGQPGIVRSDPDYFAITVGSYILGGGGLVSRLSTEVREKRGLSYSVYSYFSPGQHQGAFTVGLQTRPDQAAQALAVVREVVRHFVSEGPTAAELAAAQANLVGGFALRIDSNRKLLDNLANIAWYGLPLDYLDTWTVRVTAVTVADIQAAFRRVLSPDRMVTVVAGPGAASAFMIDPKAKTP
jgi:zinc protease